MHMVLQSFLARLARAFRPAMTVKPLTAPSWIQTNHSHRNIPFDACKSKIESCLVIARPWRTGLLLVFIFRYTAVFAYGANTASLDLYSL